MIFEAIPQRWEVPDPMPSALDLKDCMRIYIHKYFFFIQREIQITEADATQRTAVGSWIAVEVVEAFCHIATIAHQLVDARYWIFWS